MLYCVSYANLKAEVAQLYPGPEGEPLTNYEMPSREQEIFGPSPPVLKDRKPKHEATATQLDRHVRLRHAIWGRMHTPSRAQCCLPLDGKVHANNPIAPPFTARHMLLIKCGSLNTVLQRTPGNNSGPWIASSRNAGA